MDAVVVFKDVFLSYEGASGERIMVLRGVSFDAVEGDTILVEGPSGSGKTSLLKLVLGLLRPDAGTIRVFSKDPADMESAKRIRKMIGYQAQEPFLVPQLTIEENIKLYLSLRGANIYDGMKNALRLADELGIRSLLNKRPPNLSGGEARRAELILALSDSPPLLVLDEPTAMLDHQSAHRVIELLKRELRGRTALIATHDPRVKSLTSKVVRLMLPQSLI